MTNHSSLFASVLLCTFGLVGCGEDAEPEPTPSEVFVGEAASASAAIAVLVGDDGDEAVIYVCDGVGLSAWFFGTVDGSTIAAATDDGAVATATIAGDQITGSVELDGVEVAFSAPRATGAAGVFLVEQDATRAEGFSATGGSIEGDITNATSIEGAITTLDGERIPFDGDVAAFGEPSGVATWIVQADGRVTGRVTNTSGGGNCSIWSKIRQVAFGVDCTFF